MIKRYFRHDKRTTIENITENLPLRPSQQELEKKQELLDSITKIPKPKDDEYNIVLGFPGHDATVVISKGSQILEVIELERFFNLKNIDWTDKPIFNYPTNTFEYCDRATFLFYYKELFKYIRKKYTSKFKNCFLLDVSVYNFEEAPVDILDKSFFEAENYHFASHHGSHILGSFYQSNFDQAIGFSYDGGSPDNTKFNVYLLERDKSPVLLKSFTVGITKNYYMIGLLFKCIKYNMERCSFSYPGKIMALSSFSQPTKDDELIVLYCIYLTNIGVNKAELYPKKMIHLTFDDLPHYQLYKDKMTPAQKELWHTKLELFKFSLLYSILIHEGIEKERALKLVGLCDRKWNHSFLKENFDWEEKKQFVESVERIDDEIAFKMSANIQHAFEKLFEKKASKFLAQYPNRPIVLSGGGALNIILNTKIKNLTKRRIFVGPDPSDCGLGLGVMLSYLRPKEAYDNPYTGLELLDKDMLSYYVMEKVGVNNNCSPYLVKTIYQNDFSYVAELIAEGKIIGVARGGSERGPRALGNRSIICSASIANMKEILNEKVKFREWYRPFAPIVRYKDLSKYFDWKDETRYMNFCVNVREEYKNVLKAITHVDGTARVQTITENQNSFMYSILTELDKLTGIGVMVNTSFNVDSKPIINSVKDAFHMLENTRLDGIIIERTLILKK